MLQTKALLTVDSRAITYWVDRGFSLEQIEYLYKNNYFSVLSAEEAKNRKIVPIRTENGWELSDGMMLWFTPTWGQFRLFSSVYPKGKNKAQRFTQIKGPAQARIPSDALVATEGLADSLAIELFGGVPCAALMGVSHFRKLPKDSGITIVFDSDGWTNPKVITQLFNAALWVKGKVVLFPFNEDQKVGASEFFKSHKDKKAAFAELLEAAKDPIEFLKNWIYQIDYFVQHGLNLEDATNAVLKILIKANLSELTNKVILDILSKVTKFSKSTLNAQLNALKNKPKRTVDSNILLLEEGNFAKVVYKTFYENPKTISVAGVLYQWCGTHYQELDKDIEMAKIAIFAKDYAVTDKDGNAAYPFATFAHVEAAYKWCVMLQAISPDSTGQKGIINCKNGFLQLKWTDRKLSYELLPHNDSIFCIHPPGCEFNTEADRSYADTVLQSLTAPQRTVVLRALSVALDIPTMRKMRGRSVTRALLFEGQGSNGKDTIRETMRAILGGPAMCDVSLADFKLYDEGKRFGVYHLQHATLNWASENTPFTTLDNLQSLKRVITGDPIVIERKGKDSYEIQPNVLNIFNVNKPPNLEGDSEAIRSRFVIVKFTKTYKENPARANELKVDYRFKENKDFIVDNVAPGFLLYLLEALQQVALEGIPYDSLKSDFDSMARSHLHDFFDATGLRSTEDPEQYVRVADVWDKLKDFYKEDGTCEELPNGSLKFNDQAKWGDKTINSRNQVSKRLIDKFPHAKIGTIRAEGTRIAVIYGLTFEPEPQIEPQNSAMIEDDLPSNLDFSVVSAIESATEPDEYHAVLELVLETDDPVSHLVEIHKRYEKKFVNFAGLVDPEKSDILADLPVELSAILFYNT